MERMRDQICYLSNSRTPDARLSQYRLKTVSDMTFQMGEGASMQIAAGRRFHSHVEVMYFTSGFLTRIRQYVGRVHVVRLHSSSWWRPGELLRIAIVWTLLTASIGVLWIHNVSLMSQQDSAEDGTHWPREKGRTWVEIDLVQCMNNPWEIDWLRTHNWNSSAYPTHGLDLDPQEIEIIKNYYAKQGITVFDARSEWTHEAACLACSCSVGHTLYLLVSDDDVDSMLELGYRISHRFR